MIPGFNVDGLLPAGVHRATWDEFSVRFGGTVLRDCLLNGLKQALVSLKSAGCSLVYIDGSFVTAKPNPGDFDGCWDMRGVDPSKVDPVLLTFNNMRAAQKAKYLGEFFPASWLEMGSGATWLDFFQKDKLTGGSKGIVALDLRNFLP